MCIRSMTLMAHCLCFNKAACQRQGYINETSREIEAPKKGNLQEGGKRNALKERKARMKRAIRKFGLGNDGTSLVKLLDVQLSIKQARIRTNC